MVVDAQPDKHYESQMHVIESLCRRRVAQRPLDRGKASKQIRKEHVRIQNARAIREEKESGMIHPLRHVDEESSIIGITVDPRVDPGTQRGRRVGEKLSIQDRKSTRL